MGRFCGGKNWSSGDGVRGLRLGCGGVVPCRDVLGGMVGCERVAVRVWDWSAYGWVGDWKVSWM